MRVLICGIDGYLGWTLAQHLGKRGHSVSGIDMGLRRGWVSNMASHSITPIVSMTERLKAVDEVHGIDIRYFDGDMRDSAFVDKVVKTMKPDCIVHFAEQPSAPYSMKSVCHAIFTQTNNITSTLNLLFAMHKHAPKAHLLKLGTMGEYGTPNLDIPEGFFEVEYRGRKDVLPFPKRANSWYHLTKVHDTNNIEFACRTWGLRSTDIMQGVVYGTRIDTMTDERLLTRFDVDEAFGTAINRFCAQAVIGMPLTPYGSGGMKRGFIALRDSMQCLTIAMENPPEPGEYRVFNQFDEVYDIMGLAKAVDTAFAGCQILPIENPRTEADKHYYNPDSKRLRELGFRPTKTLPDELDLMLKDLLSYKERILQVKGSIMPKIKWRDGR